MTPLPKQPPDLARLRADIRFEETLRGRRLQFSATWGLFSPRGIDDGTRLLVDYLDIPPTADCLDLGCGYGPIGLTMAHLAPEGRTWMIDKDFVAVDYAERNAQANNFPHACAQLSNGFDHLAPELRFDVIASNLPAKVGKELLTLYLYDALARLRPGGQIYLVTINGLREFIKRNLQEIFGNYDKLKQGRDYTVAWARRPPV